MLFVKLFPTKMVPVTVPPVGLEDAYFSIPMLLPKGFYDAWRAAFISPLWVPGYYFLFATGTSL